MKKSLFSITMLLVSSMLVFAQEEQTKQDDYYELSLEELMNIPINSASKKDETLFDAPLSSYTITKSDIEKSGATSIMDALRMAPGVIVREQTNGNYDIHIRGFDNLLQHSATYSKTNLSTLVMINDRPVFNNNLGGTFWEALAIDLNDVERIEIVRGPSAPLFGPNAVTGVINIITKKIEDKPQVSASAQYGTPNTLIGNVFVGKKIDEKLSIAASANYQKRERWEENYYNPATDAYGPALDPLAYPDPSISLDKYGVNAYVGYNANENISFDLMMSTQESQAIRAFIGDLGASPLTTVTSRSQSANLKAKLYGATIRTSFMDGKDNLSVNSPPNQYDQQVFDFTAEYDIKLGDKLNVVPGISYQDVTFDDSKFTIDGPVFLGGKEVNINTSSAFVRADYRPFAKWRIIAAGRADQFSSPDDTYFAYEFATTYKLNEKNLLRAAVTRSNSGSFIGNNFLNLNLVVPNGAGPGIDINYIRRGNQDAKLFTVDMVELGFRSQLSKNFQLDLDVFSQKASNLNALIFKGPDGTFTGFMPNVIEEFDEISTTASQVGTTVSVNYVASENFQLKPFLTFQKTDVENSYSAYNLTATVSDKEHKNTPSVYGGYYANYKVSEKFNINSSGYFFGAQRQYDATDLDDNSEGGDIKGKFILNIKANYALTPQFSVFVNGRNILGADSQEFYGADKVGALFLGGLSFNLK